MWIYSTLPVAEVQVRALVRKCSRMSASAIWSDHRDAIGITRTELFDYAAGQLLTVIELRAVESLARPVKLHELRKVCDGFQPPQVAAYLEFGHPVRSLLEARTKH